MSNDSTTFMLKETDRVMTKTGETGTVISVGTVFCSVLWDKLFTNAKISISLDATLHLIDDKLQNDTLIFLPK